MRRGDGADYFYDISSYTTKNLDIALSYVSISASINVMLEGFNMIVM